MSQPRIFVSHSHKDDAFTERLVTDLRARGAEVWVDDAAIQHGNFPKHISDGLNKSEWLVLVLTPNAIASEWVQEEVFAALDLVKQKRMHAVIPLLAQPCQPGTIPPLWGTLHRYDATQDYAAALAGVVRAVGLQPQSPPTPMMHAEVQPDDQLTAHAHMQLNDQLTVQDQVVLIAQHTETPPIPPGRFPQRLTDLGFTAHVSNSVEYIVPPLCPVPAGPFLMGSNPKRDKEAKADEQPQHAVTLPTYEIARFPVTVAEYACFVRAGQQEPQFWKSQQRRLDHPVVNVTWRDAVHYAAWLSERTGERWRLPSEAEWEKAARGTDGRIYPWGDTFETTRCNTYENGIEATTPVGNYPSGASRYGAQDMAGNVWEWTSSRHLPYPYAVSGTREDADAPQDYVLRGGTWGRSASYARAASRGRHPPDLLDGIGIRIVRVAPSS